MPVLIVLCLLSGDAGEGDGVLLPRELSDQLRRTGQVNVLTQLDQLLGDASTLWDVHGAPPMMSAAIRRLFESNKWDTEADRFALELMDRVRAAPAWAIQERFDLLTAGLSERYLLDELQEEALRGWLTEEASGLLSRHAGRVLPAVAELVSARAGGQPFTAEQVARVTALMNPVWDDATKRFVSRARAFAADLDEVQRALWLDDLKATQRRLAEIQDVRQRWARGQWRASEWGLENDVIQQGGMRAELARGADAGPARPGDEALPGSHARDSTPQHQSGQIPEPSAAEPRNAWARYVSDFIRRFDLDDAQQRAAWRVYRQTNEHRQHFQRRSARVSERYAATGTASDAWQARVAAALERLFERMKQRLDRIPTRKQRRTAEAAGQDTDHTQMPSSAPTKRNED
jgi:hypothetical protein